MDENVKKNYEYWCTSPIFDDATKSELKSLEGNEDEIFDRFYRELEFGTGGLRGVIGAGTNRMNFYTVGKATQVLQTLSTSRVLQQRALQLHLTLAVCLLSLRILLHVY